MTDSNLATTPDPADADSLTYLTPPLAQSHPTALHSGIRLGRYFGMHLLSALLPAAAGLAVYGWRAACTIAFVLIATLAATALWRRVGSRGVQLHYSHALWLGCLLALSLPPHLFGGAIGNKSATWPLLPASAFFMVSLTWLLGGAGSARLHPVILTFLLLIVFFRNAFIPHGVLDTRHVFVGDVRRTGQPAPTEVVKGPWPEASAPGRPAVWREPAFQRLLPFTTGQEKPERTTLTLQGLLRDRMPPLEDLIIAGHPSVIGSASAIAAILGGLFLLYHGLIDYRIPLIIFLTALAAFLILPVPVVITDTATDWRWLALRDPAVGWGLALTFANYELMAGPLPFAAFFLATSPSIRPMTRRGRTIYALLIGLLVACLQLYFDVLTGPYLAILAASLLTPALDRLFGPRPLV